MAEPIRLFVGGIPASISTGDISTRFETFGEVAGVERAPVKLHQSPSGTNPNDCRGFAYVDLVPASDASVTKCCTAVRGIIHAQTASDHSPPRNHVKTFLF